jgi:gliding motility-associated-like protein
LLYELLDLKHQLSRFALANIGMDTLSFLNISVKDNACPIFGINSKTIKIEVTPASYSNASSTDIICAGNDDGSITLNPIGNYGPPWKIDLINPITYNIIQNDSNIYASYTFNNLSQGVYIVRSTDTNNCYIDTLITINEPDSITINLSPDTDICLNDSTILRAYGQDGVAPYTYSWVDFQNSDSSQLISPTVSNYYSVFAIDNLGCISSSDSIFIEILSSPTSLFTADPNITSIFNPEVIFTNASSNDVVSYYWQFFNSDSIQIGTSSQINPIYTFPNTQAGEYYTVLTVTNSNNCSDIYNLPIIIENAAFNIFVPNAFTPDGDGINDYLFVQGENLVTNNFNLIIFDKWGEKVFETNDVNEKWDGNYKNKPAQQDAYVWKIKITDPITSELKELNGHVLLMR